MIQNVKKMSLAIRNLAKERIANYPNCREEEIFDLMPDFYKLVKEDMKLLPEHITFEQFWEAASVRYQIMKSFSGFGLF